jgi:transcriptional regulator with XRE-family HTH domain
MQSQSFETYEEWDLTLPPIPERSVLFSLEPVGLGTPWVESLTSYIARLAWAHAVFPGVFMNKLLEPLVQGKHSHLLHISQGKKTNLLNATGLRACLSVQFLETLTMRSDLRHLTLLAWSEILCLRGLVRTTRAWCQECYEHWREHGEIIFDPLLWAIQEVTTCVVHQIPLCQQCPNPECARALPALCWRSRPGYCAYCQEWLGRPSGTTVMSDPALVKRQQWVIMNVGALLAHSPTVMVSPSRKRVQEALPAIIQQVTQGNISAFARTLNMPQGLVSHWVNGRKLPQLEILLHICSVVDLSLEALLLHDPGSLRPRLRAADEPPMYELRSKWSHVRVSMGQVRQALEKILTANDNPPPTLTQVAQRLGLGTPVLYKCHPEACYAISARYKEYAQQRTATRVQQYRVELREAARRLYEKGVSPTRGRIEPLLRSPGILRDPKVRQLLVEVCREIEGKKDENLSNQLPEISKIDRGGQSF